MRLSKIKLAGFKTFVDPTTISLPSNRLGVVGPNGCGKSNVIDAVRWVMGESSAKNLRGDSMSDVIFNGSSVRKPVGTALIELIFDNSDGSIEGQYASFSEVAVKRTLSRDGTSLYFINGARCRRKDITQLFLGTGLGPRSYSIIEQGMISRVVEAKPEEMRHYLEEAAGISKYKERRRETENRIRHTRDNLERLNDLRDEVEKQLRHLQRQAKMAERYKKYKEEQRGVEAELLALKLRELEDRAVAEAKIRAEHEAKLEKAIGKQRGLETKLESRRESHADASTSFSGVQENYYKLGAEVARLEQQIKHTRELRGRQQEELAQAEQGLLEIEAHIQRDVQQLEDLDRQVGELAPDLELARSTREASAANFAQAEGALQSWQQEWESFGAEAAQSERASTVEASKIDHLEGVLQDLVARREKIEVERSALTVAELEQELIGLETNEKTKRVALGNLQASVQALGQQIGKLREQDRELAVALDRKRHEQQQLAGKLASLEALQQAAMDKRGAGVQEWLAGNGLAERPRLAQSLRVADGWELAVETVLGDYLEAVCVTGFDSVNAVLGRLPSSGAVGFVDERTALDARAPTAGQPLAAKVREGNGLGGLLDGVAAADTLGEALQLRKHLGAGESVVTRDGIWLGHGWLRVNRPGENEAGLIQREHDIRDLRTSLKRSAEAIAELEASQQQTRAELKEREEVRDGEQESGNQLHREHVDLMAGIEARRDRIQHMSDRIGTLATDAGEIQTRIETLDAELKAAQARHEEARTALEKAGQRREALLAVRETHNETLNEAREVAQRDQQAAHEIEIKYESRRSTRTSIGDGLERMRSQSEKLGTRRDELRTQLAEGESPLENSGVQLTGLLASRVTVETELADARRAVEAIDTELRELDQKRHEAEQLVQERRESLDQVRLSAQEMKVRRDTVAEQFEATGMELAEVQARLDDEATVDVWEENLAKLQKRIERLGAINLAAIEEFDEQSQRKEYLDTQHADLTDALETLETAIRKIDRETRTRFKETYDKVNDGFKRLFPRLFGGGHAYLQMGDEDILTAGITVMAQPPGKRNSSIHLLSGGEKALTAVALVFAIFELNPAPFCMLDEVDAPLDDANVGRFCDIVREMSEKVQFVVITHNKTTIEMANQLVGVTMQEPGVSRLVAVDIDEAVQMAAM